MISLTELQQQVSLIFSSIIGGSQAAATPKKNYSAKRLWGAEGFADIEAIREQADFLYYKQHEEKILDAGSLYQRAATRALACTLKIEDEEARLFLLDKKVLPLYSHAHASFYKFITIDEYQKWHELNINIFKLFFDNIAKYSAIALSVGDDKSYNKWHLRQMKQVNGILRNKCSAEQAGTLLLKTARKATKLNFPEILQLDLYDLALENLATDFYDEGNYPNIGIIDNYQEAMKAAFTIATKLANIEISAGELQAIQQKIQTMSKRIGQLKKKERPSEEARNADHTPAPSQGTTLIQRATSRPVI